MTANIMWYNRHVKSNYIYLNYMWVYASVFSKYKLFIHKVVMNVGLL